MCLYVDLSRCADPGPFLVLWDDGAYRYVHGFEGYGQAQSFAEAAATGQRSIVDTVPAFMRGAPGAAIGGEPAELSLRSAAMMQLPARERIRALDQRAAVESKAMRAEMEQLLIWHRSASADGVIRCNRRDTQGE